MQNVVNLVKQAIKSFIHSLTSHAGFVRLKHSSALNYLHEHQHVNTLNMLEDSELNGLCILF